MNSKTHQSRDHKDWFKYWKDHLKTTTPLITTKEYREKNLDRKKWKIHLNTDNVWKEKDILFDIIDRDQGLSEDKDSIRGRLLEQRSNLSLSDAVKRNRGIYLNLKSLDSFNESNRIALYSPIRNEVSTESIFFHAVSSGKEVYFPRVHGSSLSFHRVYALEELGPGKYGVMEPKSQAHIIKPEELDVVLIPGAAFDLSGARLGYGKGFYDRYLRDVPLERRIGILYKFQLQKSIPTRPHDMKVGALVHEQGIVFCSSKLGGQ